ncbi:hypothetical protein KY284_024190 [Solanum tuberosum]|nr:hypothetical protein KY284_024190 [Solanum tuberosum]
MRELPRGGVMVPRGVEWGMPRGMCMIQESISSSQEIESATSDCEAKKSRVKAFIKLVNYNHIMPTHYTLGVDLKDVDVLHTCEKKVTVVKKTKLDEGLKIGKN